METNKLKIAPSLGDPSLTALERELISYVERLTQAFKGSTEQFKVLETRSTEMIYAKQANIETSLGLLIESQASLVSGLITFVKNSDTNVNLPPELIESEKSVQAALELMKLQAQRDLLYPEPLHDQ